MMIQASGNPSSMQNIISLNKQLLLATGYSEDELVGHKIDLLLPKVID